MIKRYIAISIHETHCYLVMSILYCMEFWAVLSGSKIKNWQFLNLVIFLIRVCVRIFFCLLILRFWLLYYDLILLKSTINHKWIKIIDPQIDSMHIPKSKWITWLENNREKYGTINAFTMSIFFITLFIAIVIAFLHTELFAYPNSNFHHPNITTFELYATFWVVHIVIITLFNATLIILWWKIHLLKIQDNYFINAELRRIVILLGIRLVLLMVFDVFQLYEAFEDPENSNNGLDAEYLILFRSITKYCIDVFIVRFSIVWVYKKIRKLTENDNKIRKLSITEDIDGSYEQQKKTTIFVSSEQGYHAFTCNNDPEILDSFRGPNPSTIPLAMNDIRGQENLKADLTRTFNEIVAAQDTMEDFVQYLYLDFKIQNWCAFIELFQFGVFMLQYAKKHEIDIKIPFLEIWFANIHLPENGTIPKSKIIEQHKRNFMEYSEAKDCIENVDQDTFSEEICCKILKDLHEKYLEFAGRNKLEIKDILTSFKHKMNDRLSMHDWNDDKSFDLEKILRVCYDGCKELFSTLLRSLYNKLDQGSSE